MSGPREGALDAPASDSAISLEYADAVEFVAPRNADLHARTFFIDYIDERQIRLVDTQSLAARALSLDEEGQITDESVEEIRLLSRSEHKGYARNNGLLAGAWVDVRFGGDLPAIITARISALEEDRVELVLHPGMEVIYIDFAFKGLPRDVPIERIELRAPPGAARAPPADRADAAEPDPAAARVEYTDANEAILFVPEGALPDPDPRDALRASYIVADSIIFGDDESVVSQVVEAAESERMYSLDAQTNSMLDEFLSVIPENMRTRATWDHIRRTISRFCELRAEFSRIDAVGNVTGFVRHGPTHKPLVDRLAAFDRAVPWALPAVAHRTRIYDVAGGASGSDAEISDSGALLSRVCAVRENYDRNRMLGDASKYKQLVRDMEDALAPFVPPEFPEESLTGGDVRVACDMDVVVGSLPELCSTVALGGAVSRKRFAVQRYAVGATALEEVAGARRAWRRAPIYEADAISVRALLVLPDSAVAASRAALPMTSIMERVALAREPPLLFRMLTKNTAVDSAAVESFDAEVPHVGGAGVREYTLGPSLDARGGEATYRAFLGAVAPSTGALIERGGRRPAFSILAALRELEPFAVYAKDLSREHHRAMRAGVKAAMAARRAAAEARAAPLELYRATDFGPPPPPNAIDAIFRDSKDVAAMFREEYGRGDEVAARGDTASEAASALRAQDAGGVFTRLMQYAYLLATPRVPESETEGPLGADERDDMGAAERVRPADCARRFLAKTYASLADLQRDNNAELFYDKAHDDSPYAIAAGYKAERAKYSAPEFLEFLEKALVAGHGCAPAMARELAATLAAGKKLVRDGEHALLEIRPTLPRAPGAAAPPAARDAAADEIEARVRAERQYYLRKNGHWVKDDSVDAAMFVSSNALFCNLAAGCAKNARTATCDTIAQAAAARPKLEAEAARRLAQSAEEDQRELSEDIVERAAQLARHNRMRHVGAHRANNLAYEVGNMHVEEAGVASPAAALRDRIVAQPDFAKKQHDIMRFVEGGRFCREPMLSVPEMAESPFWLYCVATNQRLLPRFMHELARTYLAGESYQLALDRICREQGALSDDNDAVVDIHSGFEIRKIELSGDEGYDEFGFKISTREVIGRDKSAVAAEALRKSSGDVFDSDQAQTIYNVFATLCNHMGIEATGVQDLVMRLASQTCDRAIPTQDKYEARAKGATKVPVPFKTFQAQVAVSAAAAALLVAVQTAVPAINSRTLVPGCVRSFEGYPVAGGIEDLGGVKYFACVLSKLRDRSSAPWPAIKRMPDVILEKGITGMLAGFIVKDADSNGVAELIERRREYDLTRPEESVPVEHREWSHFRPPIMRFEVPDAVRGVSAEFKAELVSLMKKGGREQRAHLAALHSRVVSGAYAVVSRVNAVVERKELIFRTAANTPHMKNACCNDAASPTETALAYFERDDATIKKILAEGALLEAALAEVRECGAAPFLFHAGNTRISRPPIQLAGFDANIYRAFIAHCGFDGTAPVLRGLRAVCAERPPGYDPRWSMTEKIDFFKRGGRAYTEADLDKLMVAVARGNAVHVAAPGEYLAIELLTELLAQLDAKASASVEAPLREHLARALAEYRPDRMVRESTDAMDALKNYLTVAGARMRDGLVSFLYKHARLRPSEFAKLERFIDAAGEWAIDSDQATTAQHYEEGLYTAVRYTKTAVHNMARVFPAIILNRVEPAVGPPAHWALSPIHKLDVVAFMKKQRERLAPFKGCDALAPLLTAVDESTRDVHLLLQHLPVSTPLHKGDDVFHRLFDKPTVHLLLSYCWLSVLYEYVRLSDDPDLLRVDAQLRRSDARRARADCEDDAEAVHAVYVGRDALDDDMAQLEEVHLMGGLALDLQTHTAALLVAFLGMDREQRAKVDLDYAGIVRKTKVSKDLEKKAIMDRFDPNDKEGRSIEIMLKKAKLGVWSAEMQKGVVVYDKASYDRERSNAGALFAEDDDGADAAAAAGPAWDADVGDDDAAERGEAGDDAAEAAECGDVRALREDYLDDYYGDEGACDDGFGHED